MLNIEPNLKIAWEIVAAEHASLYTLAHKLASEFMGNVGGEDYTAKYSTMLWTLRITA